MSASLEETKKVKEGQEEVIFSQTYIACFVQIQIKEDKVQNMSSGGLKGLDGFGYKNVKDILNY